MIKYICDLCGREVKYEDLMYLQLRNPYGDVNNEVALCPNCLHDYIEWKGSMIFRSIEQERKIEKERFKERSQC